MKKINLFSMMLFVALMALLMFPAMSMAQTVPGESASTGSQGWDLALTVVLPVIIAASSIIANFFEIKPTDPPAWAFVKRIINTLALNLSSKAGQ